MSLPDELADLLGPRAYPHPCDTIELVETHASWVLLTGKFVYKLKKPVRFPFLDFSTLELREHFCREELRCNRRFAPSLYLDVVPVGRVAGRLAVGAGDDLVEWAVKMRQFPADAQLDRLLEAGSLSAGLLHQFGRTLASQHAALPRYRPPAGSDANRDLAERVLAPARDNYDDVAIHHDDRGDADGLSLADSRRAMERQVARHRALLLKRLESGWIRECHGDLHLSNLVLLEHGVTAFDCLEFNANLRWIDPISDVAFLFMDCVVRDRADLGYAFVDGYLDESGDYDGMTLLPFYAAYRSMVRAKVAALRRQQAEGSQADAMAERFRHHARWAAAWLARRPGRLLLMCGLSGSGKSHLAEHLVPRLPALRLRSDVARKLQAGLSPRQRGSDAVGAGLYRADVSRRVYDRLAELAEDLLRSGEHVLVDAAFLDRGRRERFLALADSVGSRGLIVYCHAPRHVIEARLDARAEAGSDPSDADLAVLEHQAETFVAPEGRTVAVDTASAVDYQALAARLME